MVEVGERPVHGLLEIETPGVLPNSNIAKRFLHIVIPTVS